MVPVVVEVPQPLGPSNGKPPLLPGAFVKVEIGGKTLAGAVAVPRDAIHGGNRVWLVDDGRLHIKELDIVRADKEFAYVTAGIPDSAEIVVSSLDTVVEGMQVRTQDGEGAPKEGTDSELTGADTVKEG
jgi:multidrug efflux pump subunit AcrA (membrane-fusion protein)